MTVIDIRTRQPLDRPTKEEPVDLLALADAVIARRRYHYKATVADGYSPKVLPIPEQRVQCVHPVRVVESNYADVHDTKGWL